MAFKVWTYRSFHTEATKNKHLRGTSTAKNVLRTATNVRDPRAGSCVEVEKPSQCKEAATVALTKFEISIKKACRAMDINDSFYHSKRWPRALVITRPRKNA
jgi:hypothetical protein